MRKRFSDLQNSRLFTADDAGLRPVGYVTDLLIEDGTWNVRYLVVSTDMPLSRQVLISPAAIAGFDFTTNSIATILTKQQVVESPSVDFDKPISRQYEQALVDHYSWPIYWLGRTVMKPQTLESAAANECAQSVDESKDSNLRSATEICGYQIHANDAPAGVLNDLVLQLDSWTVDYASAESSSWLPEESSLISTSHIEQVDWSRRMIAIDFSNSKMAPSISSDAEPAITGEPWSSQPLRTT